MLGLRRRDFIALLGGAAAAWPLAAKAQQGESTSRIGLLWPGDAPPASPRMESFRQGPRALGFVDGQNVAIELRYAQRGPQQLPELAAELVRLIGRHFCIRRFRAQSSAGSDGDDPHCRNR